MGEPERELGLAGARGPPRVESSESLELLTSGELRVRFKIDNWADRGALTIENIGVARHVAGQPPVLIVSMKFHELRRRARHGVGATVA